MRESSTNRATEKDRRLARLMQAAQDGDGSAYSTLLKEITPWLRQMVRYQRRFLQPQDIEDLVQDTLLSLHAVRATYDPKGRFCHGSRRLPGIAWPTAPVATSAWQPTRWSATTCP
jgi:hypothetical protein